MKRAGFYMAMFIKVDWYFLFLIHYSLSFQYPVTNFTITSKRFARNSVKTDLISHFRALWRFALSNYTVVMPLSLEPLEYYEQENICIFWYERGVPKI